MEAVFIRVLVFLREKSSHLQMVRFRGFNLQETKMYIFLHFHTGPESLCLKERKQHSNTCSLFSQKIDLVIIFYTVYIIVSKYENIIDFPSTRIRWVKTKGSKNFRIFFVKKGEKGEEEQ